MRGYKINPYTGLPPRRKTAFSVVQVTEPMSGYVIVDAHGNHQSRILTKPQLDVATQHTINAVSFSRTGDLDDRGQALVNFRYEKEQAS